MNMLELGPCVRPSIGMMYWYAGFASDFDIMLSLTSDIVNNPSDSKEESELDGGHERIFQAYSLLLQLGISKQCWSTGKHH